MADLFDTRVAQLKSIGFRQTNIGLTNDTYYITYSQMQEFGEDEWKEWINEVKERSNEEV